MIADDNVKNEITNNLNRVVKRMSREFYAAYLFDHVQTHAVYGLEKNEVADVKKALKELGAKKFRKITNHYNKVILCFDAIKMKF